MSRLIDLTGKVFERLTVVERFIYEDRKGTYWKCQCECGNEKIILGSNLTSGKTKSCGCYRKDKLKELKLENLIGQEFGRLKVIALDYYNEISRQYYWKCVCKCGGEVSVYGGHLKDGHTQSCGCLTSKGEEKISNLLQNENLTFKKNFRSNLLLPTGGYAKYDFVVYKDNEISYLIEYDGWQHTTNWNNSKWDRDGKFEIRQKSDYLKNEYCLDNKIPLIRIPHTQYKNLCIEDLKLETSSFLIERTQNEL